MAEANGNADAAAPNDWPMFRHDARHTGYSTSNAPSTNQTLWSTSLEYYGASPSVAGGRVYMLSRPGPLICCLNAATGEQIWNSSVNQAYSLMSSPSVVDGKVYVGAWRVPNFGDMFASEVLCFNAATGALLWWYSYFMGDLTSITVADGRLYLGQRSGQTFHCLDAATGGYLWSYTIGHGDRYTSFTSSPAVADGKVYVGSVEVDGKVYCLDAASGAFIWSYTVGAKVYSSPAIADGKVYVGSSNKVYCLSADTGGSIWNYTTGGDVSSPAVANGKIYIGSNDHNVYCLDAATGAFIWNYTTGDGVYSPVVADGKVYVGSSASANRFCCLNASTGEHLWDYADGGNAACVAYGVVYTNNGIAFGSPSDIQSIPTPAPVPSTSPTPTSTPSPTPTSTAPPSISPTPTKNPTPSATTSPVASPTISPSSSETPTPSPTVPEFPTSIVLVIAVTTSISLAFLKAKKTKR